MANPTSNFGWQMPTNTDLVKDLPADFEVFGQAIDTDLADLKGGTTGQVLSKTSGTDLDFTWVTPTDQTPLTTKGDLFGYSTADARIPVGANGTVLTADSAETLGLKWATPAGGSQVWTLLNTGGTALSGAATITISGISNQKQIMIFYIAASSASASSGIFFRINGDTGSNYSYSGQYSKINSTYGLNNFLGQGSTGYDAILSGAMGSNALSQVWGGAMIYGTDNSAGDFVFHSLGRGNAGTGSEQVGYNIFGVYEGSAALTSISINSSTGNFDNGTVYVWGC